MVLLLTAIYVVYSIPGRLIFTLTPSLPHRFYLKLSPEDIKRGEYILFHLHGDRYAKDEDFLLKRVVCTEGNVLFVRDRKYYCNEFYLGEAKEYTLTGERLDNFVYTGRIPEGYVFVLGNHPDSYDSRYFGLVHRSQIVAKAYPLL